MNRFKIEGMDNLIDTIKRLEKLPQKHVTAAAKSGAQIALKAAKAKAPGDPGGNLKKGIILKGEKKSKNGKKIYDVMMDPAMNDIFCKGVQRQAILLSGIYGVRVYNQKRTKDSRTPLLERCACG